MTPLRTSTRKLLADLSAFGVFHSLLCVALYLLFRHHALLYWSLGLFLPFFAMCAARNMVRNIFMFAGIHLALAALPLFLPLHPLLGILGVLFMLACSVYSLVTRIRGVWHVDLGAACFFVGLNAVLSILSDSFGLHPVTPVLTGWSFVIIFSHLVCSHTLAVDHSVDIQSSSSRQPVTAILRFNNLIIVAFLALAAAAAALAPLLPMDTVVMTLWRGFRALARRIMNLLSGSPDQEDALTPQEAPAPLPEDLFGDMQPKITPRWMEILETILLYGMQILLAVGAVIALVLLLRKLYQLFYAAGEESGDVREYIGPSLRKEKPAAGRRRGRLPLFGLSEQEKVRRRYFRRVRRHIRKGVPVLPADTTGQISNKIPEQELDGLTDAYNRARYGED